MIEKDGVLYKSPYISYQIRTKKNTEFQKTTTSSFTKTNFFHIGSPNISGTSNWRYQYLIRLFLGVVKFLVMSFSQTNAEHAECPITIFSFSHRFERDNTGDVTCLKHVSLELTTSCVKTHVFHDFRIPIL